MCGLWESPYKTSQASFCLPKSHLQASTKRTYTHATRPFSNSMSLSQLRTNWIGIKWRTWSLLENMVSATHVYDVHIHIKIFSLNLDESQKWPHGSSKAGIPAKAKRFLSLKMGDLCTPNRKIKTYSHSFKTLQRYNKKSIICTIVSYYGWCLKTANEQDPYWISHSMYTAHKHNMQIEKESIPRMFSFVVNYQSISLLLQQQYAHLRCSQLRPSLTQTVSRYLNNNEINFYFNL